MVSPCFPCHHDSSVALNNALCGLDVVPVRQLAVKALEAAGVTCHFGATLRYVVETNEYETLLTSVRSEWQTSGENHLTGALFGDQIVPCELALLMHDKAVDTRIFEVCCNEGNCICN